MDSNIVSLDKPKVRELIEIYCQMKNKNDLFVDVSEAVILIIILL